MRFLKRKKQISNLLHYHSANAPLRNVLYRKRLLIASRNFRILIDLMIFWVKIWAVMDTFYKIIYIGDAQNTSFFVDQFHIRGLSDLWTGRCFEATNICMSGSQECMIQAPYPVIHFCDNALDALLWRGLFGHVRYVFEIEPIGQVFREKCNDQNGLYQCGARGIKLQKLITEDGLIKLAQAHVYKDPKASIDRYTNVAIKDYIYKLCRGGR